MQYKYSVDSRNRLLIKSSKFKTRLKPNGAFQINKNNQLEYWLNEPASWRCIYNLPRKIVFEGNWKLNANHDLELVLNKARAQSEGGRLTLKGSIISVENNSLVFEIAFQKNSSLRESTPYSFRILRLTGSWQADEFSRLIFQVEKKLFPDALIFKSSWKLNKNQQIEYTYEKVNLARKTRISQTLIFSGFWKIDSAHRLVYILSQTLGSGFDFKVQLENPNIYPQDKSIKYRLGAGLSRPNKLKDNLLVLYGEWKFDRNLGLVFRMQYGKRNIQELEFGVEVKVKRSKFLFNLKNEKGEPLGITLTYSFSLLNSLEPLTFISLKSRQKELGIEAGFSLHF